ncbi:hypothetical protein OA88_16370 [Flavobacterium sp. JRM]|nr:hypothetical protein OA88_16370 [Flavobacterium sp. JRM]
MITIFMDLLKNKIAEQKKRLFINSKIEFYKSIFNDGFLELILMENFKFPELNTVISLLESVKIQQINYRLRPTLILDINNEYMINNVFKERLINFFDTDTVNILFSYIYDLEISGYISLTKNSFVENFHKLTSDYGFILSNDYSKFIYYNTSLNSKHLYIYEAIIEDKKFIKIIY